MMESEVFVWQPGRDLRQWRNWGLVNAKPPGRAVRGSLTA